MSSISVLSTNFQYRFKVVCATCGKDTEQFALEIRDGLIICPNCDRPL